MSHRLNLGDIPFRCPEKGARFPEDFEFITIHQLCNEEGDQNRYTKVLLLVTLYIKTSSASSEPQNWYSKKDSGSIKYERIIYAMDVNAPSGHNIVAIILGKSTNINFFKDVLTIRDGPYLGPGGVFAIESPSNIDQFMSGSQVPLLFTPDSIISMDMSAQLLPERLIDNTSAGQHAFCYNNVQVHLYGLTIQQINCCGNLCDAYGMYENSCFAKSCGCIQLNRYQAHLSGIFEFVFQKEFKDGTKLYEHVKDVTSKKMTKMLFRNGDMPVGLTAAQITKCRRTKLEFRQKAESAFNFVNQGGSSKDKVNAGFTVMGWVRRGKIADRGVTTTNGPGVNQKTMVDSSSLIVHVTSVVPTSDKVAKELANNVDLLFDANALLRENPPNSRSLPLESD